MNKSIETDDSSTPDSLTWKKEFRPLINGKPVRWDDLSVVLMKGEKCTLALEYEYSYYIGEQDGFLVLDYKPGDEGQRLVSDPPLGVECEMAEGSLSLSWTISAVEGPGGAIELVFTLPRDPQISESPPVPGRVIENWSEGFVPWVNGQRVSWSDVKLDLMQGETCTLALSYEGSSLIGDPAGFLALDYMPGAEGQGLVFDPPLGVACEMAEGTTSLSWTITREQAVTSPFELQFALSAFPEFPKSPSLPGRLSDTWLEGFAPLVNGKRVNWPDVTLDLMVGESCTLALDFKDIWLIGEPAGFLALEYKRGAEGNGLIFEPKLGEPCEMKDTTTSLSWTITRAQADRGTFELQFALPKLAGLPNSPPLPVRVIDLERELTFLFATFPMNFAGSAYPCHGARHTFTVLPTSDSLMLNKKIKLLSDGENLGVRVNPRPADGQLLIPEGVIWELDCSETQKDGVFRLQLMADEHETELSSFPMHLGNNLVRTERWEEPGPEPQKGIAWKILATSVFTDRPAAWLDLSFSIGGEPEKSSKTNETGINTVTVYNDRDVVFKIVNLYDGTVV